MKREEAIDLLDNLKGMIEDSQSNDYDEAFNMAIEALEQEPRSKGHWTMINNFVAGEYRPYEYKCSECGFGISMCRGLSQDRGHNLFCQHCGADMR